MASKSNIDITNSPVGAVIQGGNVQTGNIIVNANTQPEVNESEFDLPRLIGTFHGRKQEFNTLEKLFFIENKNKIVVHGLPGYGKTELCKQFAQRCLDEKIIERVFWIKAEHIDGLKKYSVCLKKIYKKYEALRCMFVFDNALNRRSIYEYEISNNDRHRMLVTSHFQDWGHGVVPVPLDSLTSQPVMQIFNTILEENYREEDHSLYLEIGRTVDNVPLGVQIVAGYVRQGIQRLGQSFQLLDYVEEMKQSKHKIMHGTISKDNPNPYKNSIYGALTVSLNKIKEEEDIQRRELAVTVLYACAFLNPERIQCDDFIEIPTIKELIRDNHGELELKSAIRLLVNFSFVNYRDTDEDLFNINRLVQSYLRQYLCSCEVEEKKCYNACVYAMFSVHGLLRYADVSTEQECIEFLKKVFQNSNGCQIKIIYEYALLYKALEWNKNEILKLLIQHADINETKTNGYKVMYSVARTWNVEAVELLIARGVDVNHRDAVNRTPMDSLLSELANTHRNYLPDKIMSTLTVLLSRGALFDKNLLSKEIEFCLLSSAVKINKLNVLKSLIQNGLNVNSRGSTPWRDNTSILHEAVEGGNYKCIQMLISHGADVNARNTRNETALFLFVKYVIRNNRNIDKHKLHEILVLFNCKAHAHKTNIWGQSLLHYAAHGAHEELVTVLIGTYNNYEVNKQDYVGNTPLHELIWWLSEDSNKEEVVQTVRTLIRCGASLNIKNRIQQTPLNLLKLRSKKLGENFKYLVPLLTATTTNTEPERKNCTIL